MKEQPGSFPALADRLAFFWAWWSTVVQILFFFLLFFIPSSSFFFSRSVFASSASYYLHIPIHPCIFRLCGFQRREARVSPVPIVFCMINSQAWSLSPARTSPHLTALRSCPAGNRVSFAFSNADIYYVLHNTRDTRNYKNTFQDLANVIDLSSSVQIVSSK